jgi:polyketide synthase PksN
VAPGTKTEEKVVELLENFLGVQGLGVEDNFFDLGGDSLKAMSFLVKIKNTFDIHLAIKEFFTNPTIRKLSQKIDENILLSEKKIRSSKLII